MIKIIRNKLGFSQKELDRAIGKVSFTYDIENNRRRTSTDNLLKVLDFFNSLKNIENINEYKDLEKLIRGDYKIFQPKIEKIPEPLDLLRIKINNRIVIDGRFIIDGEK